MGACLWGRTADRCPPERDHIEIEDLDFTPFDEKGGRGKMYQLFGAEMTQIIEELNEILAA